MPRASTAAGFPNTGGEAAAGAPSAARSSVVKLSVHSMRICAAAFCESSMTLASAAEDGSLHVWDLQQDEPTALGYEAEP